MNKLNGNDWYIFESTVIHGFIILFARFMLLNIGSTSLPEQHAKGTKVHVEQVAHFIRDFEVETLADNHMPRRAAFIAIQNVRQKLCWTGIFL